MSNGEFYRFPNGFISIMWRNQLNSFRTIVTAYVPAMYIPDPDNKARQGPDAPIRHFDSGKAKLEGNVATWDSPNYLTGLAGAFVSMVSVYTFLIQSQS